MNSMLNFVLSGMLGLSILFSAFVADAAEYKKYCNARYGFCLSYPGGAKMDPPPQNDDGRRFTDGKGFSITASASNNVLEDTLQSAMESQKGEFDKVTYSTKGQNWYALSGFKGGNILYVKTFVGKGSVNNLEIEYPADRKAEYDAIVAEVVRSFKAGSLNASH